MNLLIRLIVVGAVLLTACKKVDFDNISDGVEIDARIAAPIVRGHMSMADLFTILTENDTLLITEGDTLFLVLRSDSVFDVNALDYADLPDYVVRPYHLVQPFGDVPAGAVPGRITFQINETYDFIDNSLHNGRRIDSMWFQIADVVVNAESTIPHGGTLTVTCPSIIDLTTGEPFRTTLPLNPGMPTYSISQTEPVEEAKVYIANPGGIGDGFGKLNFVFDADLVRNDGQGLAAGDEIEVNISFQEITYGRAFGYFGQITDTISSVDTLDLGMLDNATGTFSIADPRIVYQYENSIGVPFGADLHLTGHFEDKPEAVATGDQAIIWYDEDHINPETYHGEAVYRNIDNIEQILAIPAPESVEIASFMLSNPTGDTTKYNYVYEDSKINVDMQVKVPLHFMADITLRDTMPLELGADSLDGVDVTYATLHFYMENSLPLDMKVEAILYDSVADKRLDTLIITLLTAAEVGTDGIVNMNVVRRVEEKVTVTDEMADRLFDLTSHIIVVATINTTKLDGGAQYVKILTYNGLDFKIGLDAAGTIKPNEF